MTHPTHTPAPTNSVSDTIYNPIDQFPPPQVDPNTDPDGAYLQAFGPNLITNGDFSAGMGTTPDGSWRTGPIPSWTVTGPAAETIHGPYGGDPTHHVAALPSGFYFDSEASPGNTKIAQTFTPPPFSAGVHEVVQIAFENVGGVTTSTHDTLHITLGTATLDISVNDFKTLPGGAIDYNHLHQFVIDTSILDPLHPETYINPAPITTTIQEIGPDAAHANVGFAVTGIVAYGTVLSPPGYPV